MAGEYINTLNMTDIATGWAACMPFRPYKKNDQCRIEQKNWDIIRKMIAYGRFDTYGQLAVMERIYGLLTLYQNYFQPSQKLVAKQRIGSKVKKKYDAAQTPCQRLLSRKDVSKETKKQLRATFSKINPAQLLRQIHDLISELYNLWPMAPSIVRQRIPLR